MQQQQRREGKNERYINEIINNGQWEYENMNFMFVVRLLQISLPGFCAVVLAVLNLTQHMYVGTCIQHTYRVSLCDTHCMRIEYLWCILIERLRGT